MQSGDANRYGAVEGSAVGFTYVDDSATVRNFTFVTSEAGRVLDTLERMGVRIEQPQEQRGWDGDT